MNHLSRIRLKAPESSSISGEIVLPASKSISNRALILRAFDPERITLHNLSDAEDTRVMERLLASGGDVLDVGRAGSAMRFLTAHWATIDGARTMTGDERMKQRPVGVLVDALRELGAEIDYLGRPGFPPMQITGEKLKGGRIRVPAGVSSQFITALMLIAPRLEEGLDILLQGEIASRPYLQMTVEMLRAFGIQVQLSYRRITIQPGEFDTSSLTVEADWSSASYWYAVAALSWEADIVLPGLSERSWQGDRVIADLFKPLGIVTSFRKNEVRIQKVRGPEARALRVDCREFPDMAQTLAAVAVGLRLPAYLSGLNTLRIKETDRIEAMAAELRKMGGNVSSASNDTLIIEPPDGPFPDSVTFATHRDHRMALALAPLALVMPTVEIEDPDVVIKSYPGFWNDLGAVGFSSELIKT